MADSLAVIGILLCGLTAAAMLICCAKSHHSENSQLDRLRGTTAYQQLKAGFSLLSQKDIDEVRIECSGITVTSVCPAHIVLRHSFKQNGNSKRNDTMTRLFAELIAHDFPLFTRRGAYKFTRYRTLRPNGRPEEAFAFTMRRGYKDFLLAERCPAQLRIY